MRFVFLGCILAAAACAGSEESVGRDVTMTSPELVFPPGSSDPGSAYVAPVASTSSSGSTDASPPPDAPPPPPPPPPPPTVVTSTESISVWGHERQYVLAKPSTYDPAKSYPLLLALHGDGGSGPWMRDNFKLDDIAGQSLIVAYPTGSGASWDLYSPVASDEDVAFLEALVGKLRGTFNIGHAFSTGISSGGFMSNQMACRRPSLFKGIISQSGGAPNEPNESHGTWGDGYVRCNGQSTGVAAMIIHGSLDTAVPYPSGEHNAKYWARVNGCGSSSSAFSPSPCVKRDGCPADKPVVYCGIEGLGHWFWSEAQAATWAFISSL